MLQFPLKNIQGDEQDSVLSCLKKFHLHIETCFYRVRSIDYRHNT